MSDETRKLRSQISQELETDDIHTIANAALGRAAQAEAALADILHDLQLAVGQGFTTSPSAAVEAVRRIGEAEAERDAVDEFLADLLALLPGAQDQGSDAYDQIPRGIRALIAERDQLRATIASIRSLRGRDSQGWIRNYVLIADIKAILDPPKETQP